MARSISRRDSLISPPPRRSSARRRTRLPADINQYAITWGAKKLRDGIARHMQQTQGMPVDPETEITVTCGSTEAMIAALMAVTDPGDEVVIFEPFYENYGPDTILSGAQPRFVTLHPPATSQGEWSFDEKELRAAINPHTRPSS